MKFYKNTLLLVVPLMLLAAFPVFAAKPQAVTACETFIEEPGKYRLTTDLVDCEAFGVDILASDVTLDLKGHTISCAPNGLRTGGILTGLDIRIPEGENPFVPVHGVKITNGTVTGCADGILLAAATDSKVTKMTSTGNLSWYGISGTGITVWYSYNNVLMHNHVYGNPNEGIASWESSGNLYKHNTTTENFMGIWTNAEDNAQILCNRVHGNAVGIGLGGEINGSLVRGNLVSYNFYDGISLVGIIEDGEVEADIPSGNTIRSNIAEHNGFGDLFEGYWGLGEGDEFYILHPDGTCLNTWHKNQYGTALAPPGCIGESVLLEEDDVCALDDD